MTTATTTRQSKEDIAEEGKARFRTLLKTRMTAQGISKEELASRANEYLKSIGQEPTVDERFIQHLRSTGIPSPDKARKPQELAAIATALECRVLDFWYQESEKPEAAPATTESDYRSLVEKVQVALQGPKASFLRDAIDLSYTASLVGRKSY